MKLLKKLNKDEGVFLLECNHIKRINLVKYSKCLYKCQECALEKVHNDAKAAGLMCVSNIVNGIRNDYIFSKCGHTVSLTPQNVRNTKGILDCKTCFAKSLVEGEIRNDIKILDTNSKPSTRMCLFNCCGLVKQTSLSSILSLARCPNCHPDLVNKRISLESSLEVIPNVSRKRDYRLFNLPCGHTKEISIKSAKRNLWLCRECNLTSTHKETNVYLFKITINNFSWLKVGYAHNIKSRIAHYGLPRNTEVVHLHNLKFENAYLAIDFEQKLHNQYKDYNMNKELVKPFMKSGYTECYPVDIQETLTSEFTRRYKNNEQYSI